MKTFLNYLASPPKPPIGFTYSQDDETREHLRWFVELGFTQSGAVRSLIIALVSWYRAYPERVVDWSIISEHATAVKTQADRLECSVGRAPALLRKMRKKAKALEAKAAKL